MTELDRRNLVEARGRTCQYCGATGDRWKVKGKPWEIDHVVPIQYGGAVFDDANLALACHDCNVLKSDTLLDALPQRLERIAGEPRFPSLTPILRDHAAAMLAHSEAWPAA